MVAIGVQPAAAHSRLQAARIVCRMGERLASEQLAAPRALLMAGVAADTANEIK
jgi:hypothetical protein